jgi:hypothetical protein
MLVIIILFFITKDRELGIFHCRYLAHGTATDYMYEIVKVPMAFTFEVKGFVYFLLYFEDTSKTNCTLALRG